MGQGSKEEEKAEIRTRLPSKKWSALWAGKWNSYWCGRTIRELLLVTFRQSRMWMLSGKVISPRRRRPWKPVTTRVVQRRSSWDFEEEKRLLMKRRSGRERGSFLLTAWPLNFIHPFMTLTTNQLARTSRREGKSGSNCWTSPDR